MSGPTDAGVRPDVVPSHNHGYDDLPVGVGVGRIFTAPLFQFQAVPTTVAPAIPSPTVAALLPEMTTALSPTPFVLPPLPTWLPGGWRCDVQFDGLFSIDFGDGGVFLASVFCVVDGVPDLQTVRGLSNGVASQFGTLAFHKRYYLSPGPHTIEVAWTNTLAGSTFKNGGGVGAGLTRCFTVDVYGA